MLEQRFRLKENGTTVRTEVIAGLVTFMTMSYIIFVNPSILEAAGVPKGPAIVATALAAAATTLFMGLTTNYPFALASGMGLNAFLAFGVVLGLGVSWQTAMGIIFVEGLIVTLLVLTRVREQVMDAIPLSLKRAIGVAIGLFIAFIGLQLGGIVIQGPPATLVTFGTVSDPKVWVTAFGLFLTAFLMVRKVHGAILIGILGATAFAIPLGQASLPATLVQFPGAGAFATFFQLDVVGALQIGLWATIFAFLMTDFFDTMGTVVALGGQAGFLSPDGRLPRLRKVLLADSLAAVTGGLFGVSSVTTYIESAAGIAAGGRTGLTSVVVAVLFVLAVFFAPLIGIVPGAATAPALIIVGYFMMTVVKDIPWDDVGEALPAFVLLLTIPLTFSIARGIGYGFITYTLVKALGGRPRDVHPFMWIVSALFLLSFFVAAK